MKLYDTYTCVSPSQMVSNGVPISHPRQQDILSVFNQYFQGDSIAKSLAALAKAVHKQESICDTIFRDNTLTSAKKHVLVIDRALLLSLYLVWSYQPFFSYIMLFFSSDQIRNKELYYYYYYQRLDQRKLVLVHTSKHNRMWAY